jgi:hypothetical protein
MATSFAFLFFLCGIQYPFIDASESTTATIELSGFGTVLVDEDVRIYYCPNETNALTFKCNVQNSSVLQWSVSSPSSTVRMNTLTDDAACITKGIIHAFLNEIETNSNFTKGNFTSIMFLDTVDLDGPTTTVSCNTSNPQVFHTVELIAINHDPFPFDDFSALMFEQDDSTVIAILQWEYPGNRAEIRGYRTQILDGDTVVHERMLDRNVNGTSFTLLPGNTFNASVQAISRCNKNHRLNVTGILYVCYYTVSEYIHVHRH